MVFSVRSACFCQYIYSKPHVPKVRLKLIFPGKHFNIEAISTEAREE